MNEIICKAINEALILGCSYKGVQRWIEPHTYGLQPNGKEALCAWQLTGGTGDGYRLFLVVGLMSLVIGERFGGPRPGYHRGDQRFLEIYSQL